MIRKATQSDIPEILEMYEAGLRELGETDIRESMILDKVVSSYHLAPCFLLVINGNICGMAALTVITSPWNGDASLADYMFYVQQEHRNIKTLGALVDSVKQFSIKSALPVRLEFATEVDEKIRKRLFEINGFKIESVIGAFDG